MKQIQIKFDIGDECFCMYENEISRGTVANIHINLYADADNPNTTVYDVIMRDLYDVGKLYGTLKNKTISLSEEQIFPTEDELINNLRKKFDEIKEASNDI
jgi:hypothetical protein